MKERLSEHSEMRMMTPVKKYKVDYLDKSHYLIRYEKLNIIKDGLYEFITESKDHKYPKEKRKIVCDSQTVISMNNYVFDRAKRKFLLSESRYIDDQFLVWESYDESGHITRRSKILNDPKFSLEMSYWDIPNVPIMEERWAADGTHTIGKVERKKFIVLEKYNAKGQLIGERISIRSKKYGKCYCFENTYEDGRIDWTPEEATLRKLRCYSRENGFVDEEDNSVVEEFLKEVAAERKKQKEALARQSGKVKSHREKICPALDKLNKLKPSQYRKEAKEALVRVYRSFYPKKKSR